MSENDLQVEDRLWRVIDIYKTAGLLDEMVILENFAFFALCWHFRDELNRVGALNFENQYLEYQSTPFRKTYDELDRLLRRKLSNYTQGQTILPSTSSELRGDQQIGIFKAIFEMFDAVPNLGQWFDEYLIPYLSSMSKGGRYATPRHLVHFMVGVVGLRAGDSLADFACGTGGMLVANGKLKWATGVEISINMARLALTNLILHEQEHTLHLGNAFDLSKNLSDDEQFDVVLMNPPWGAKLDPYLVDSAFNWRSFFSGLKGKSETLFTALAYERLKPGGRMAIMVPSGLLFSTGRGEAGLREFLVRENVLQAIVSLPRAIENVSTHIFFAKKPRNSQTQAKNLWFYRPPYDGFSDGKNPRPIEENHLPLVQAACNTITEPSDKVQVSPLFSGEEKVLGYAVHTDDANLSFKVRALGSDYLIDVSNPSEAIETIYVNDRKVYRGEAQPQEIELNVFKKMEFEGEFSLSSLSGGLLDEKTKYSIRLKKGKGEIRRGQLSKVRFGGKTKEDVSAVGVLLDSSNRVISEPIPLAIDKFGKSEEMIGFSLTEKDAEKPIAFLLIFSEPVKGIPLSSTNGRETIFLCHSDFDPKISLFYDPKAKKFSWSIRVMVDQQTNVSIEDGEIFRSDQVRTGVVFDTKAVIVGVYVNRQEILSSKNTELLPERYWVEKQQTVVTRPTAQILGEIKKKQNRLTGILDQLLSISEIQALAGSELPPRLKMSEYPVENLQGMQQSIWKVVQTQTEQVNGYATAKPFQSDDINEQLTEKVSVKDIQSTLELFERMGLIVAVSYEGIPYFRLPEERDWVAGRQA